MGGRYFIKRAISMNKLAVLNPKVTAKLQYDVASIHVFRENGFIKRERKKSIENIIKESIED